jgi:ATP-dependent DNA helicase RecQ
VSPGQDGVRTRLTTERDAWLERSKARARSALEKRIAPADRLALIQTLARLDGGRLDLAQARVALSNIELAILGRFGLSLAGGGTVIRIDGFPPGLESGLVLDPNPRTVFATAPPDGQLLRFSQHERYRSTVQKAAVNGALTMPAGGTLMVSMPTGSGKSLLFQIFARWWRDYLPGACVAVITPTVALAEDHERTLRGLPGLQDSRALTGAVGSSKRTEILNSFRRGDIPVLLLSPETAFASARENLLEAALPPDAKHGLEGRLVGFFIDEAHIVESWGRSFRPDFQRLPALVDALIKRNPEIRTILLSATLTNAAREVLRNAYKHGAFLEIHAGVPRYDFDLVVETFDNERLRSETLLKTVDRVPRPAIIYTTQVQHAKALHKQLIQERDYERVALFTGDISATDRRRIISEWANEELDVVVATSAFGLGIDKQNVRTVIHACLPESAARYYQEIGRASRDGHQGLAVCLWTRWRPGLKNTDDEVASDLATNSWLSRDIAEARWLALRESAEITWDGATRRARVLLDSARVGLGPWTGHHNRRWNTSLLNLMQRAEAIRVEHVLEPDDGSPVWECSLLDDGLLESGPSWAKAWNRIFVVREAERQTAKMELTAFKSLMAGRREDCLLAGVFELIEPSNWDATPCGRCPTCRTQGTLPPATLHVPPVPSPWPKSASTELLPPGIILLSPDDPTFGPGLFRLLQRLASVDVQQFVVADGRSLRIASFARDFRLRFGFVHALDMWASTPLSIADLPTAILIEEQDNDLIPHLRRLSELANARPHQSFVLVADARRRIEGRQLAQIASPLAPYEEEALDALAHRHLETTTND